MGVGSAPCTCCLGSISDDALDALAAEIEQAVRGRTRGYAGCPTCISVITPPILDTGTFTARILLGDEYSSSYIFDPFQSMIEHALPCLLYKLSPYNSSHGNHEIV